MKIGIIGLGKLGLPLAAAFASRGFEVIGVDINEIVLKSIRAFRPLCYEPNLPDVLKRNWKRLHITNDLASAVNETDATIIIVGTPSEDDGCFSLKYVLPVCLEIGKLLREKKSYHLLIISSTVNPTDCEKYLLPEMISRSQKEIGLDFGFCYVPEFVALGNVMRGFLEPDFVLIGAYDDKAAAMASGIYSQLCLNNPPIKTTNLVNAELAKIAANCHTVIKTVFANQMAELCEAIPNANVDEVTDAIGMDSRASPEYLKGSTAALGPCFGRDMKSLPCIAERYGVKMPLIRLADDLNYWQIERLARMVSKYCIQKETKKVGILGLTYKLGVNVYEPSAGLLLLEKIKRVWDTVAYDPAIVAGSSVQTAEALIERSDIIVVTMPWKEFGNLEFRPGQVIIDCWRCLDGERIREIGSEYVAIGRYRET